jgi:23S rRNA-/tRNA-specific pseudouridylate synthase
MPVVLRLYEDTYLIIVSKPVHLNCAPSREHPHDSLIERVMYYLNHSTNKVQYVVPHIVTSDLNNTSRAQLNYHEDVLLKVHNLNAPVLKR